MALDFANASSFLSFPETAYAASMNTLHQIFAKPLPSSGCGKSFADDTTTTTETEIEIEIETEETTKKKKRRYRIHLPPSYTAHAARPAIFVLHGANQTAAEIERITQFSDPGINPYGIAVYPEMALQEEEEGGGGGEGKGDEMRFLEAVLDDVEGKFCVDRNRIYGAGFGDGGGLLGCLGKLGSRAAAVAVVSGRFDGACGKDGDGDGDENENENENSRIRSRMPFLEIHGDRDTVAPYEGTQSNDTLPIRQILDQMLQLNGCGAPEEDSGTTIPGLAGADSNSTHVYNGGAVVRYSWTCAQVEQVVENFVVKGLGHGWPSTTALPSALEVLRRGPTSWNASQVISEWFGRWALCDGSACPGAERPRETRRGLLVDGERMPWIAG
ncbi:alpha beta-hydrolase [Lecanosticta acicola]|uniref:feruloyl esterase n=1 Tax=Lecanosticta acicola TaxID=111012 RepID=A0AAI9E9R3_9PEZI|nr:alpha beta-hydrolase [Lecanosticta acicola]